MPDDIISDLVQPLWVIQKGYRVAFEDRALAYEETTKGTREEFRMRVRVVTRGMNGILSVSDLLMPWKYGWVSLHLLSHKVLRWLVSVFLILLFLASAALYQHPFLPRAVFASSGFLSGGDAIDRVSAAPAMEAVGNSTLFLHVECGGALQHGGAGARPQIRHLANGEDLTTMKIEFISQDDPLYILPFFEEFFRNYSKDFEIAQVSISRAMGKRPRTQLLKELACLYRPTGFARILGRVGFSKMMGALPRSRASSRFYTLAQLCRAYGVPCQPIGNPNAPEFIETVKQRSADVIVSVACPFILKETFLNLPPLGCINIHHAPLPRYKGMMPTFWQMFHGEKKVGVTVHYMVPKIDEGQALLQAELKFSPANHWIN